MSKMFMNVKEVMEVLEVSESYAYKLMKRLNAKMLKMQNAKLRKIAK